MRKDVEKFSLNCVELLEFQQNRYPFLLVDHIEEVVPGKYAKGHKNLTWNEWYFPVHFPDAPNMPGALQIEALAQVLTIAVTTQPGLERRFTRALDYQVKFRREVVPGERFDMYAEIISWKRGVCRGKGVATVNGELACEAEMLITIPEILDEYLPKNK